MKPYHLILFFITLTAIGCSLPQRNSVVIENRHFSYEISPDGTNLRFKDKSSGQDYLDNKSESKCAYVMIGGEKYDVTSVSVENNLLNMKFGITDIAADIQIIKKRDQVTMRVTGVTGDVESLTFLNVPLNLEGQSDEQFGACVLSMNLFTHVRSLPPFQAMLWASCYDRFGLENAEITLLGLPTESMLSVIRDIISKAKDIPFSDEGGAWALMKKGGYGSYLMNFGTLTEETVDEWIDKCRKLGFNQIDSHGGGDFFKFGSFELNKEKWPDGWESFKRINSKLHEAGISHILHTYSIFIEKNSRYVTPVPSEDMGYSRIFTLKEPVTESSKEITVNETTANIAAITGFNTANSVTLKIGSELIEFSGVTKSPPYKFTGLKRGAFGTKAALHDIGQKAYHLSELYGRFVPGPGTTLFDEIAQNHAQIVNDCEFDGIYFDASEGASILDGRDNFWYHGTKFIFEVVKNLKHPVIMEMSSMAHHWWHYRSRYQAWDRPVKGYKKFIDIHLSSIKTPELMLPLHLGWWGNQTWAPPQIEPTFSDDIEYLGCKMIGNDAGFSQLGGVDDETFKNLPLFRQSSEILKQYEELRQKGYFNEDIKKLLRQPGKEFTLFKQDDDRWNFRPAVYQKHRVTALDDPSSSWSVNNEFDPQPIKLRLEVLMSVKSYDDPSNIVLTNFSRSPDFVIANIAKGVIGEISSTQEAAPDKTSAASVTAKSSGESPQEGSYISLEKKFDPIIDLSKNQALGVWVKGDGNGQILNFSHRSPRHISYGAHGDHFIKIDFIGWNYFELVETESSAISDYKWPTESQPSVYNLYRNTINFKYIEKLQLWYNNLPKDKEVKCLISRIKAIPMTEGTINSPAITVGNKKVIFPVKMKSGMYLELKGENNCKLYESSGKLIEEVKIEGELPQLQKGKNVVTISGKRAKGINTRLQITIISEGEPLTGL